MTAAVETDENGDPFEVWIVKRSFALLAPVCTMGLFASLLFLCVADPLYFTLDTWSKAVPHSYLAAWHAAAVLFFGGFWLLNRRSCSPDGQHALLQAFVSTATLLFVWFGVVSWLGTGDLSIVAMEQVLIAAVFNLPGNLRRWLYALQGLALGLCLAWLDQSGEFLGQMQFVNLLVMAIVAYAMDGYMRKNAKALFSETCRVASERRRADAVLYNALPVAIAEELKATHHVKAQSFPAMAILFADIVGFTAFAAQREPEQVLAVLGDLFSEMDALVDAQRVEKIKTIGDAYMAVSHGDAAAIARLALAMRDLMQRYNATHGFPLALRIGMHCGPTIAGVIGSKRFLYDVWGDAVNLASRMESSGAPGRIQASEEVFHALQDGFVFEERGPTAIKGKGLLPTYFLLGPRDSMQASSPSASGYTP
jgi:class 3 adenylate cyclase